MLAIRIFGLLEAEAGPLTVLSLPPNFAALVRIITGQQLSTAVARAIYEQLSASITLEPEAFLVIEDAPLRAAGLSFAKMASCWAVAAALVTGTLDLDACKTQPEFEVMKALTAIKGVGPWTAEIFKLFSSASTSSRLATSRCSGPMPLSKALSLLLKPAS